MPSPTKGPRLGAGPAHERLMLANLATSLFEHGAITTTVAKAKRLRPLAERLITFAKRGDLHARRQVTTVVRDKDIVYKLFAEIGPMYSARPGGYTRIIKLGPRRGDNAPMAQISLVEAMTAASSVVGEAERARGSRFASRRAPTGRTAESARDLAGESETAAKVAAWSAAPAEPEAPTEEVTAESEAATDAAATDAAATDAAAEEPEAATDQTATVEAEEAGSTKPASQQDGSGDSMG